MTPNPYPPRLAVSHMDNPPPTSTCAISDALADEHAAQCIPSPQSASSTSTTTAIFTARPQSPLRPSPHPQEAGFLVTKPTLSAHSVLSVTSKRSLPRLPVRTSILDSNRKRCTVVNPASETLQSSGNNNTGLAF